MSAQPQELSGLPTTVIPDPKFNELTATSTGKSACATQSKTTSLLDEPWRVRVLPEEPRLPPGVLPAPEPHVAKSLPWRRGDVTRLKDDSPKGMMEYIATHTTGWWQEMAERALRDTEKAERMAREAGWQPGQYWSLEVDVEAKQKLLDAEEARRQRDEAERVKEVAEKEMFMQRQMELLKKAGRAPRCEYVYTDGRGCRAPQVKGERWCHGHAKMMSYRPEKLELEPMEDEQAVMVNLYRVTKSLLAGRISEKTAGLMLWSVAIGMPGARRLPQRAQRRQRKARKSLPRMNADERGSKKKQAKAKPKTFDTQRNGGSAGKTAENRPQINTERRRSEKRVSRQLTRMNTHQEGALGAIQVLQSRQKRPLLQDDKLKRRDFARRGFGDPGTQPQPANIGPSGDPGVTRRKSFKSGVAGGGTLPHRTTQTPGDRVSGLSVSRREALSRCLELSSK